MEKLSFVPYAAKCVLGSEIMYALCLVFGSTLSGDAAQLHHKLLELLPGFTWLTPAGVIAGGIVIAVYSFIFGLYVVWMYNSSLRK